MQGMSATIYREMPAYAGQFMVYELVKRWLISLHNTETYKGTLVQEKIKKKKKKKALTYPSCGVW